MSGRLKSGLSLLLMLLIFAVSSHAAVCDLACGLEARRTACHALAVSLNDGVKSSAMPAMSHSHCASAMREGGAKKRSAEHERVASFMRSHGVDCLHAYGLASEDSIAENLQFAAIHWTVVEVLPVAATLPGKRLVVSKSPPVYSAPASLLTTLRI